MKLTQAEVDKMTDDEAIGHYENTFSGYAMSIDVCRPETFDPVFRAKYARIALVTGKKISWRRILGKAEWEKARDRGEVIYV